MKIKEFLKDVCEGFKSTCSYTWIYIKMGWNKVKDYISFNISFPICLSIGKLSVGLHTFVGLSKGIYFNISPFEIEFRLFKDTADWELCFNLFDIYSHDMDGKYRLVVKSPELYLIVTSYVDGEVDETSPTASGKIDEKIIFNWVKEWSFEF